MVFTVTLFGILDMGLVPYADADYPFTATAIITIITD